MRSHEDAPGSVDTRRRGPASTMVAAVAAEVGEACSDRSTASTGAPSTPTPNAEQVPQLRRAARPASVPPGITACLFDLDGVLTQTAKVHAAAWKQMFDDFLLERARQADAPFRPFAIATDYAAHVDGKLRTDGVRAFLASRGIALPVGSPDDPPTAETVHGLGTRKNTLALALIRRRGVAVYPGSVRFVEVVRDAGLRRAVVSASKNCRAVLAAAGIEGLFEVRIDGLVAAEVGLPGKPAPDMFLAAAAALGVEPARCAVFEDAVAGVAAGRAGRFGWVVGVDRGGQADALRGGGADTVVGDLGDLLEER